MYAVGLMSGTSADGIDAALIEISGPPAQPSVRLLAGQTYPYAPTYSRPSGRCALANPSPWRL